MCLLFFEILSKLCEIWRGKSVGGRAVLITDVSYSTTNIIYDWCCLRDVLKYRRFSRELYIYITPEFETTKSKTRNKNEFYKVNELKRLNYNSRIITGFLLSVLLPRLGQVLVSRKVCQRHKCQRCEGLGSISQRWEILSLVNSVFLIEM